MKFTALMYLPLFLLTLGKAQTFVPSKTHKKYVNQIVFSNAEIVFGEEDESTFISKWKLGDSLYYRSFWGKPKTEYSQEFMKKTGEKENTLMKGGEGNILEELVVKIDGNELYSHKIGTTVKKASTRNSGKGIAFRKDLGQAHDIGFAIRNAIREYDKKFKVGSTYKLELESYIFSGPISYGGKRLVKIYSGELTIVVTEDGLNKYKKLLCQGRHPNAMKNAALEEEIIDVYNSNNNTVATKAIITSKDWKTERNRYGVILKRYVLAHVKYTNSSGLAWTMKHIASQEYNGESYSKKLDVYSDDGGFKIHPSCLVK